MPYEFDGLPVIDVDESENITVAMRADDLKSPGSVPAPLRQWPPNNPTFREYEELKRQGWYKADKA